MMSQYISAALQLREKTDEHPFAFPRAVAEAGELQVEAEPSKEAVRGSGGGERGCHSQRACVHGGR